MSESNQSSISSALDGFKEAEKSSQLRRSTRTPKPKGKYDLQTSIVNKRFKGRKAKITTKICSKEFNEAKDILREMEAKIKLSDQLKSIEALEIEKVVDKRTDVDGNVEYKVNFKDFDGWVRPSSIAKHLVDQYEAKAVRSAFFEEYKQKESTFFDNYSLIGEVLGITEQAGGRFCLVLFTDSGKAGFVPYEIVKEHAEQPLVKYYEKEFLKVFSECKIEY